MRKRVLKFGFPTGAIKDQTVELFKMADYEINFDEKFQKVEIDDPEINCFVTRPIEIASFIERAILDVGIVTTAAVLEIKAKLINIGDLGYEKSLWQKAKVVLAVPENSMIKSLKDLTGTKIVTRIPNITKEFLRKSKISAEILFSDMLVNESKVGFSADAIVEFYNRGSTLEAYKLKPIATLMESGAFLAANKNVLKNKWKREKIQEILYSLQGTKIAQEYTGVILHAQGSILKKVLLLLPALKAPTVTRLQGNDAFDVLTVAKKQEMRLLIPQLKKIGCTDIIEFPVSKIVF